MNHTIRQSQELLAGMRQRSQGYNAAARRSVGLPQDRPCRFQVYPAGRNTFDVLDRTSGQQRGARHGHLAACEFAKQLERQAELQECQHLGSKHFGFTMALWALLFGAVIASIMLFGV
jgi:hypothetical protein